MRSILATRPCWRLWAYHPCFPVGHRTATITVAPAATGGTQKGCSQWATPLLSWQITRWSYRQSAAAAGGAAAFADVAAAGRAHLRPAGEAQRGIRRAALLELDQLSGAVRAAVLRRAALRGGAGYRRRGRR